MKRAILILIAAVALVVPASAQAQGPYGSAFYVCGETQPESTLLVVQWQYDPPNETSRVSAWDSNSGRLGRERLPEYGLAAWIVSYEGAGPAGAITFKWKGRDGQQGRMIVPYAAASCPQEPPLP